MNNQLLNIKKKIQSIPLIRYASIAFIGTILAATGNYIFNLLTIRLLQPESVAIFQSLNALMAIIGVISTTIAFRTTQLTAQELTKKTTRSQAIYKMLTQNIFFISLIIGILIATISPFIQRILHIENLSTVFIIALITIPMIMTIAARGILQGALDFTHNSINMALEVILKLLILLGAVYIGLEHEGPLLAIGLAALLALIFAIPRIKKQLHYKKVKANISYKELSRYTLPTFLATIGITLFYALDVLVVQYLFGATNPTITAQYAALSLAGKIIFFATNTVATTIFPMISKERAKGNHYPIKILKQALLLTLIVSGVAAILYNLMPVFIMTTLFGEQYKETAQYLGQYGILAATLAFVNVFTYYYLANKQHFSILSPLLGIIVFLAIVTQTTHTLPNVITALLIGALTSLGCYAMITVQYYRNYKKAR